MLLMKNVFDRQSQIVLILANIVPIYGVIFWDWSVAQIFLLYWSETVLIVITTLIKMILTKNNRYVGSQRAGLLMKIVLIILNAATFAVFMAAHLFFLILIIRQLLGAPGAINYSPDIVGDLLTMLGGVKIGIVGLAVSHIFLVLRDYFERNKHKIASLEDLAQFPVGRLMVMQFLSIFGLMSVALMKSQLAPLLIFMVMKTGSDLYLQQQGNSPEKRSIKTKAQH